MTKRQNLVHQEDVQMRRVICDNDGWSFGCFARIFPNINEKQDTQNMTPNPEHGRTPFSGFFVGDKQCSDWVEWNQSQRESRIYVNFINSI